MNTTTHDNKSILSRFGLAPGIVILILLCDLLLFGGEAGTGGVFLIFSFVISLLLGGLTFLWQWISGRDRISAAFFKGIGVAVLTAIPSPLATMIPVLMAVSSFSSRRNNEETAEEYPCSNSDPGMRTAKGRVVSTRE